MRSNGVAVPRDKGMEEACLPVLQAAYGKERVDALQAAGLLEQPMFININKERWAGGVGGGWGGPLRRKCRTWAAGWLWLAHSPAPPPCAPFKAPRALCPRPAPCREAHPHGWVQPSEMLWAVPVNMTEARVMTEYIHESILWARSFSKALPLLGGGKHAVKKVHPAKKGPAKAVSKRRLLAVDGAGGMGQDVHVHMDPQRHMLRQR
jgi:hypothetical protein